MLVRNVTLQTKSPWVELAAEVDGHCVWFRFPEGHAVSVRGDPFLAAALLPAMLRGEPVKMEESVAVSPRLIYGIDRIQDVMRLWFPRLKKVEIEARLEPSTATHKGVGCFYSGGVDGAYTFLRNKSTITDLLFVKGIDMQLENDALFDDALKRNGEFAQVHGVRMVPIVSNVRFFGHRYKPFTWDTYQASGLASLALASGYAKVFIAASHTYAELFPWGSHPLIDAWWSTEGTEIIHDGAEARRSDKLRRIAEDELAMQHLRVCWQDRGYNCGRCEKCVRTMVGLHLLGLSSPALPAFTSVRTLKRVRPYTDSDVTFFVDNIQLADEVGETAIAKALRRGLNRQRRRKVLVEADRAFFGGLFRRLYRKLTGRSDGLVERPT